MNDIKILEKLEKVFAELKKDDEEGHSSAYELQWEDINAIENLINRIKELENKNKVDEEALEEYKGLNKKLANSVKELEEENKQLDKEAQGYLEELAGDTTAISILYNKQISRVKELEEIEEEHRKENGKLKEELKEIKKEYSAEQKHEMKNTIPKSKIKEKIEELEKDEEFYREQDRIYEFEGKINILKQLLEEQEDK